MTADSPLHLRLGITRPAERSTMLHYHTSAFATVVVLLLAACGASTLAGPRGPLPQPCAELRGGRPAAGGDSIAEGLLQKVDRYGTSHRAEFAGAWVHGRGIAVAFTDRIDEHGVALNGLFDGSIEVIVVAADHPLDVLETLKERVTSDMGSDVAGQMISTVGVDIVANRVAITLPKLTDEAGQVLAQRYGVDKVCVAERVVEFEEPAPGE